MALTPEQKTAHDRLDTAIGDVLHAMEAGEPRSEKPTMVDWLVVVEGVAFEQNGDSMAYHNLLFRGGQLRLTVAHGLLTVASDLLTDREDA